MYYKGYSRNGNFINMLELCLLRDRYILNSIDFSVNGFDKFVFKYGIRTRDFYIHEICVEYFLVTGKMF